MQPRKEVHFRHEGQDYFISLPNVEQQGNYIGDELVALLASHGIFPIYNVEEDVRGRYLSIYVNQSLRKLQADNISLPNGVELRQGNAEPYLYVGSTLTIICHDPDFMAIVDKVWREHHAY